MQCGHAMKGNRDQKKQGASRSFDHSCRQQTCMQALAVMLTIKASGSATLRCMLSMHCCCQYDTVELSIATLSNCILAPDAAEVLQSQLTR